MTIRANGRTQANTTRKVANAGTTKIRLHQVPLGRSSSVPTFLNPQEEEAVKDHI